MSKLKISVAICTYNRAKFIEDALLSLERQSLPYERFQVIIINNNSTDATENICQRFIQAHPEMNFTYVVEKQQGLSFARNRGIQEAIHPIVSYIDDDAIAHPDFLKNILEHYEAHPETIGVGGKIIPKYETARPEWMSKYLEGLVTKVDLGEKVFQYQGKKSFPVGCNMTYRKTALEECGGFNEALKWRADDKYIYYAISQLTDQVYYVPTAVVEHQIDDHRTSRPSFVKLCRKTGNEEGLRVRSEGWASYFQKLVEYTIKFGGSIVLALPYLFSAQWSKANYLITYRYQALLGLLGALSK